MINLTRIKSCSGGANDRFTVRTFRRQMKEDSYTLDYLSELEADY